MGIGPCGDRGRAAEVVGPYGSNVGGLRRRRGRFLSSLWWAYGEGGGPMGRLLLFYPCRTVPSARVMV